MLFIDIGAMYIEHNKCMLTVSVYPRLLAKGWGVSGLRISNHGTVLQLSLILYPLQKSPPLTTTGSCILRNNCNGG
jgi:hypothetical protein